jgi:hypothetical protein
MRRGRGPLLLLAVTPALLAGCHRSPEDEQETLRRELTSWDATAQLTRELSERGSLPRVYVRQISEVVEQGKHRVRQRATTSAQ